MSLLADFEELAQIGERRGSARRSLRLKVGTRRGDKRTGPVTVHNLSLTGVLIETAIPLAAGVTFAVDLPEAGTVETSVIWNSGELYGCLFRQPISGAALIAALLSSSPRETESGAPLPAADLAGELPSISERIEKIVSPLNAATRRRASNDDHV